MAPLTYFDVQIQDNTASWEIELTNIVIPESFMKCDVNNNADTAAFRTATKASVYGVRFLGCYFAPSFREISSKAHTDTF